MKSIKYTLVFQRNDYSIFSSSIQDEISNLTILIERKRYLQKVSGKVIQYIWPVTVNTIAKSQPQWQTIFIYTRPSIQQTLYKIPNYSNCGTKNSTISQSFHHSLRKITTNAKNCSTADGGRVYQQPRQQVVCVVLMVPAARIMSGGPRVPLYAGCGILRRADCFTGQL